MSDTNQDFDNPYRAPVAVDMPSPDQVDDDAVVIRRTHLKHEASIQGIGSLYVLGGVLSVLLSVPMGYGFLAATRFGAGMGGAGGTEIALMLAIMLLIVGIGVFQLIVGLGMRKVKPWVKIPAMVFSLLGMLNIPIGTLLGIYTLYLIFSAKGNVVLAESYQRVIAQTPEIKYKTSIIAKVFVVILLVFLAIGLGAAIFAG